MTKHGSPLGRFCIMAGMFAMSLGLSGCARPEIAQVLNGYCSFQRSCEFATINQDTQYHNIETCTTFHQDLLENTAKGKSGCREEVQDFFIIFMESQMEYGCDATLVYTLNHTKALQDQLRSMLTCVKEKNADTSENINADMAQMGMNVLNTLEISIADLDPDVLSMILGTVIGS